jgi:hypothetical protein
MNFISGHRYTSIMTDIGVDELRNDSVFRQRRKSVGVVEINGPDGQRKTIRVEDLNDADAQLATQFGYNPVFKREFGYLSTFSFAVSISGLFATIMTTFSFPLNAGGSSAAVWCWLISGAGCMCIAVSIEPVPLPEPWKSGNGQSRWGLINVVFCCRARLCVSHFWGLVRIPYQQS